jgi:hypothetical protein
MGTVPAPWHSASNNGSMLLHLPSGPNTGYDNSVGRPFVTGRLVFEHLLGRVRRDRVSGML